MDVVKPKDYSRWNSFYWVGFPLAVFILICSIILWQKLKENNLKHFQSQLENTSQIAVSSIKTSLQGYIGLIVRMGKRWEAAEGTPRKIWYSDANNVFTDTKIFQSIEWADEAMRIQWAVPAKLNQLLRGVDLSTMPNRYSFLVLARDKQQPIISHVIDLLEGTQGFLIIVPLAKKSGFDGYIIASMTAEKIFHELDITGLGDDFGIAVYENNKLIYSNHQPLPNEKLIQQQVLKLYNLEWKIYLWPTPGLIKELDTPVLFIVLASGVSVALLVLIIFFYFNESRINFWKMIQVRRDSEEVGERLEKIIDTVNEGFLSFDENGSILDWNPHAEKIFGWTKEEAIGKNVYMLVVPKRNRAMQRDMINQYVKTHDENIFGSEIEFNVVRHDGTELPVEAVFLPLQLDGGHTFHVFVRDISARKKAEIDQARLTSIIEGSADAIISTDLYGTIITWNHGAEDLYGHSAHEIVRKSVTHIYATEDKTALTKVIETIKQGKTIFSDNALRKHRDGHIFPVSVVITPIYDKKDKIIGISSISRDVTERNKIERMKNEFISIVSHELRTPLTSIRGSLGLIASEKICNLSDKARQLLTIANNNCERLICLINDILDIEKIESGKMEFQFKPIQLDKLIQETIAANQVLATKYQVKLEFDNTIAVIIHGDEDRLMQVMTNLLSNAIRYSPGQSSVKIKIVCSEYYVRVSVSDDGPGIPPEFRSKIFEKFTQVDSSSTRKKGGTGLGLNICKSIIEKHNGEIDYFCVAGKGTTFYFDLPYIKQENNLAIKPVNTQHAVNILSVENDDDVVQLLTLLLQDKANVWHAHSLAEAKKLLTYHEFELVILDLNLPDGEGASLLPCLNPRSKQPTPVIIFSIDELDKKYAHLVAKTLLKSKISNEELCAVIESIIQTKETV